MCKELPSVIEAVVNGFAASDVPDDTVVNELKEIADRENGSFALALYMLGFGTYRGFNKD